MTETRQRGDEDLREIRLLSNLTGKMEILVGESPVQPPKLYFGSGHRLDRNEVGILYLCLQYWLDHDRLPEPSFDPRAVAELEGAKE